jgi:hypothetical protein
MLPLRSLPDQDGLIEAIFAAGHMVASFGGVWHADDPEAVEAIIRDFVPPLPEIDRPRMAWFLAFTGLDEARDRAIGALRATDRQALAMIEAHQMQERFGFEQTARIVEQLRPFAADPGAEALTGARLREAWQEAARVTL